MKLIVILILSSFALFFNAKISKKTLLPLGNKIYLSISIHVEGTPYKSINNYDKYKRHLKSIDNFTRPILEKNPGAKFNYELSHTFILQDKIFGGRVFGQNSNFAKSMKAKGHSILLHADIGGSGESDEAYLEEFKTMKKDLKNLLEEDVIGASGICGENNWIESLKRSGVKYVTSLVEYCKKSISLKNQRVKDLWVNNCKTPGGTVPSNENRFDPNVKDCHGIFPEKGRYTTNPITLSNSKNWLNNIKIYKRKRFKKFIPLIGFTSMQIGKISCLSNYDTLETECNEDPDDLVIFKSILQESIILAGNNRLKTSYLNFVLSIGNNYSVKFSEDIADILYELTKNHNIKWKSLDNTYRRLKLSL